MAEINNGTNETTNTTTEMAYCVFCGKQIKAGARFCPACGSEQKTPVMPPVAGGGNPPAGNSSSGQGSNGGFPAATPKKKKGLPVWALIGIIVLALGLCAGGYALISALSSNESQTSDRKRDREDDEDEEKESKQSSKIDKSSEDAKLKTFDANFRTITSAIGQYQAAHKGDYPVGTEAEIRAALLPYLNISSWDKMDNNPTGAKYEFSESTSNATFQLTATYTDGYEETHIYTFPANRPSSSGQNTTTAAPAETTAAARAETTTAAPAETTTTAPTETTTPIQETTAPSVKINYQTGSYVYVDSDGYKFKVTVKISPWILQSDSATINAVWSDFNIWDFDRRNTLPTIEDWGLSSGDRYYSKSSLSNGQYNDKASFSCPSSYFDMYYAFGTFEVSNITEGFDLSESNSKSPDFPIKMQPSSDSSYDSNPYMMRVFYSTIRDMGFYYGSAYICPKMTRNYWGPVTFIIAHGESKSPNHPDGEYREQMNSYVLSFGYDNEIEFQLELYDPAGTTPIPEGTTAIRPEETTTDTPAGTDVPPVVEYPPINAGSIEIALGSAGDAEVGHDVYAGTPGKDYTDENFYTYNDYVSGTSNMNWNPLSWETSTDSTLMDYLVRGFYGFELNSTKTGWAITCEMAADYPVDVTSQYAGKYGIAAGDTNKAWKIALNPDATWENGTPINADTYIYSYKQLLDPMQLNRRADSLYAGNFTIVGAKEYFYAGRYGYTAMVSAAYSDDEYVPYSALKEGADGILKTAGGDLCLNIKNGGNWGSNSLTDYSNAGYFKHNGWAAITDAADKNGYVKLTKEFYDTLCDIIAQLHGHADAAAYAAEKGDYAYTEIQEMLFYGATYPEFSWDGVGILKTGDYELVFITANPTESPNYYVPYYLSSTYLVYEPLFESLKKVGADGKVESNPYGTTKENTMSYGPYVLSYFELDKQFTLDRNENWYGYKDGKHLGQYQADKVVYSVLDKHETQILSFLNGEIDNVGLQSDDMEKYGSSKYIRYNPQSYTTKLSFNTDENSLAKRGTTVLGNLYFRKGFSLAFDRATFAASYTAAGSAGYGMLNYMYVYDPFTGASYRAHEAAMAALCDLYGLTYGEGGDYDDVEEAYDAITGYDMEEARECMKIAYEQMKADGTYKDETVEITLSVYKNDDGYVQMFNFLNEAMIEVCKGTGFEGKVSLKMKVDEDYYESMRSGGTDVIFSTWGGAAYSPFTLLYECYCDAADGSGNQMEIGFDTTAVSVTININGHDFTESLQTWALWMDNQDVTIKSIDGALTLRPFGEYDADSRCKIFAKCEYAYLANYVNTPIYYRNSGLLVSQKGDYAVTEYVDMVGFGGLAFYTFQYTDEEWAKVAGTLTY